MNIEKAFENLPQGYCIDYDAIQEGTFVRLSRLFGIRTPLSFRNLRKYFPYPIVSFAGARVAYVYGGRTVPPFTELYKYPELSSVIRIASIFVAFKDEVFTAAELRERFHLTRSDLTYLQEFSRISFSDRWYYGSSKALFNFKKHLERKKIPFKFTKGRILSVIMTIEIKGNKKVTEIKI